MKDLKEIPKTFRKNGFDYELLKREGNIVLYKKAMKTSEGIVEGYEVHKVRLKSPSLYKYKKSDGSYNVIERPKMEILAGNVDFGSYGWDYQHYENALKKYEVLKKNV